MARLTVILFIAQRPAMARALVRPPPATLSSTRHSGTVTSLAANSPSNTSLIRLDSMWHSTRTWSSPDCESVAGAASDSAVIESPKGLRILCTIYCNI